MKNLSDNELLKKGELLKKEVFLYKAEKDYYNFALKESKRKLLNSKNKLDTVLGVMKSRVNKN